jgi:hypothetical protein
MEKIELSEIECMLVVIYKKFDDMERKAKGSFKSAPLSSYYEELKKEADKVRESLEKKHH